MVPDSANPANPASPASPAVALPEIHSLPLPSVILPLADSITAAIYVNVLRKSAASESSRMIAEGGA